MRMDLDRAVASGVHKSPIWWRVVNVAQHTAECLTLARKAQRAGEVSRARSLAARARWGGR
jgi:hypothetical protein